jgi:hypothetical protein
MRLRTLRAGAPPYRAAIDANWQLTGHVRLCASHTLSAALAWYRAATPFGLRAPRASVPTLYVWGSGDPALGPRAAVTTGRWVTGAYGSRSLPVPATGCPSTTPRSWVTCCWNTCGVETPGHQAREGGFADAHAIELGGGAA